MARSVIPLLLHKVSSENNLSMIKRDLIVLQVKTLDAADAVIVCVTLAYTLDKYKLEADWNKKHSWYGFNGSADPGCGKK